MKGLWKIFYKVLSSFLVGYFVMMGIFTFAKQKDVEKTYTNYIFQVLGEIEQYVQRYYTKAHVLQMEEEIKELQVLGKNTGIVEKIESEKSHNKGSIKDVSIEEAESSEEGEEIAVVGEERMIPINDGLNHCVAYSKDYQIYGTTAVYKEKEQIAGSGIYLIGNGLNWNMEPIAGGNQYIDLEKWLSEEELEELILWDGDIKEDKERISWIKASGYTKGDEVYPEEIQLYEIVKSADGIGWKDEDAKLIKSYQFNVEDKAQMVPYASDWWDISVALAGEIRENTNKYRKKFLELQQQVVPLKERLGGWNEVGYEWTRTFNRVTYENYQEVETETGTYDVVLEMTYKPWNVAMGELKLVYLFSCLSILVMSVVLTIALWRMERKKDQLEENRRQLVDSIGHELKTPLAIIQSYSEGLKEKIAEDKREHYLEVIIDETSKMNELILEMIELSRLENSVDTLKLEILSLKNIVEEALKGKEKWLEEKQLTTELKLKEEWIKAENRGMEQIVHNLLINAINHAEVGSMIEIGYKEDQFYIQNKGATIPEEKLVKIWDAFYKGNDGNYRSGEGTGLGLAIVAQICKRHHMTYGVENISGGVRFWIGHFRR